MGKVIGQCELRRRPEQAQRSSGLDWLRYCRNCTCSLPHQLRVCIGIVLTGLAATALAADEPASKTSGKSPAWEPAQPEAIQRWRDMRFGMFIHWGPVSLKGTEIGWSRGAQVPIAEYDNLYKQFNPKKFDADQWAAIAKAAGMKYIVLTTKHHDGFCLWDTKHTDYNIMNTPFQRDVVKELAAACRKQGIAFGTYYSVCDWHHPDFPLTSPGGSVGAKSRTSTPTTAICWPDQGTGHELRPAADALERRAAGVPRSRR